jgi:hypothetical protein
LSWNHESAFFSGLPGNDRHHQPMTTTYPVVIRRDAALSRSRATRTQAENATAAQAMHVGRQAGLDNGDRSWQVRTSLLSGYLLKVARLDARAAPTVRVPETARFAGEVKFRRSARTSKPYRFLRATQRSHSEVSALPACDPRYRSPQRTNARGVFISKPAPAEEKPAIRPVFPQETYSSFVREAA